MTKRFSWWCVIAVVGIPLVLGRPAVGQDAADRDEWRGTDLWTNDDNWTDDLGELSGQPSPTDLDRWALITSGTVIVDEDISTSGLTANATVQINNGASLTVDLIDDAFSVGQTQINGNGTVAILGNGKYTGAFDGNNAGTISLETPDSLFEVKGDFRTTGTLGISITDSGVSTVKVAGDANVRGVIAPTFQGVDPGYGDAYQFLTGADSVTVGNATVELPEGVTVGRGLNVTVEETVCDSCGTPSALIVFGNLPILQVHRQTGAAKIENAVGDPITMTGYNITSKNNLLGPDGLSGLNAAGAAGWEAPNPKTDVISEINLTGDVSIAEKESIDLGTPYNGGPVAPADEDVVFQFSTTNGDIVNGFVEYVGAVNDFVANVNPESGEIILYNMSPHIGPVDMTGYQVISASESLDVSAWTSINDDGEAGWTEANPKAGSINEISLESSKVFENSWFSLGNIFKTDGAPDIQVQYSVADGDKVLNARIEYLTDPPIDGIPPVGDCLSVKASRLIQGDLNGDNKVDFSDFLVLSTNFNKTFDPAKYEEGDIDCDKTVAFADFLVLSTNFNMSAEGAAHSVPEPSGIALLSCCVGLLVLRRRRSAAA